MKKWMLVLSFFCSQLVYAVSPVARYTILPGLLHSGGVAKVDVSNSNADQVVANLSYEIESLSLSLLAPQEKKRTKNLILPPEFIDERGYLELETKKVIVTDERFNCDFKFLGRVSLKNKKNAYKILIMPKDRKSTIEVVYHPSIGGAGWGNVLVTLKHKLKQVDGYQVAIKFEK